MSEENCRAVHGCILRCEFCPLAEAAAYARAFAHSYYGKKLQKHAGELRHFRAMSESLVGASTAQVCAASHEYHGAKHQVSFVGQGRYSRAQARCELSDLAVLAYHPKSSEARLTYIQAKYERLAPGSCCGFPPSTLATNLEQWDLLARRPTLTGVAKFAPPPDLLSSAARDSIGTFVFFVECGCGHVDLVYSVARDLVPIGSAPKRYGRVAAPRWLENELESKELRSAWWACAFASGLADLQIGTPFNTAATKRSGVDRWLVDQLAAAARETNANGTFQALATELGEMLGGANSSEGSLVAPAIGAKQLVIIRSETEHVKRDE